MFKVYIFLLFTCLSFSQGNILHFDITNGLPHDITYGIFQDKEGYIWIGTDDGLVKFDGQDFKLFSTDDGLRSNFIIDIKQDSKGDILLATWGGGLHIIRNDRVLPIKILKDETEKINNIQIWNDNLIVKNASGNFLYKKTKLGYVKKIIKIDNNSFQEIDFNKNSFDKEFITVLDNNLFSINDLNFLYHNANTSKKGITTNVPNNFKTLNYFKEKKVNCINKVANNEYIATEMDSLFIFNKNKILRKFKINLGNQFNYISKITSNRNSYFILATDLKGFKNCFIYSKDFTTKLDLKQVLKIDSAISDFLIDNENNIWLTTFGNGVYCYNIDEKPISYITKSVIEELAIYDIKERNNVQYVLSSNFLTILKDGKVINKIRLTGIGKKITLIGDDKTIISSVNVKNNVKNGSIEEINGFNLIDLKKQKKIYVNDSIFIEYYNKKIQTNKRNINDAIFYRDTLWFATNLGMFYYDTKSEDLIKKAIGNKRLPSNNIRKFLVKKNALWIATNKGLCKFFNNKIINYNKESGLISEQINTFILDHNQVFWIGTNRGVSVFDEKKCINITTNRGLLSPFVNVIFEDSKNNIWIGGDKGISIFNNNNLLQLEKPPLIVVEQQNQKFNYTIISYNRSKSLVVEYRLNDKWVSLNAPKGKLNFSEQKKGVYKFQIRAKKQDGNWGYSKVYSFKVTIPWYKDPVYIIIGVLVLSFVIILIILRQLNYTKARNEELKIAIKKQLLLEKELSEVRENIAQDFHDDLGNKLARISLLSNLANEEISSENEKLKTKMVQIENDANYLYKGTKDFIFSLKEESNYLEELVTYLTDFGQDLFNHSNKKFIVIKDIENNTKLPYYWSKQLIYIFKEAFTNALKHSSGNEVVFKFSYSSNIIEVSCSDNGSVFSTENKKSNGLTNMKKRAEKLGADLKIEFSETHGVTIKFKGKTT